MPATYFDPGQCCAKGNRDSLANPCDLQSRHHAGRERCPGCADAVDLRRRPRAASAASAPTILGIGRRLSRATASRAMVSPEWRKSEIFQCDNLWRRGAELVLFFFFFFYTPVNLWRSCSASERFKSFTFNEAISRSSCHEDVGYVRRQQSLGNTRQRRRQHGVWCGRVTNVPSLLSLQLSRSHTCTEVRPRRCLTYSRYTHCMQRPARPSPTQ